jgi:hypothetical protein
MHNLQIILRVYAQHTHVGAAKYDCCAFAREFVPGVSGVGVSREYNQIIFKRKSRPQVPLDVNT